MQRTVFLMNRNMRKRGAWSALCIVLVLSVVASCAPSRDFLLKRSAATRLDKQYVRVLLLNSGDRVTISSKKRIRISDVKTREVYYDGKGGNVHFYPERVKKPVVVESWESPLSVNGKPYRGLLELHNVVGRLHVINVVTMSEYLCGVVPSEISSSWNAEALKAQAVAARTFAWYHLINKKGSQVDFDATTSFQVYGGAAAETDATNRAVAATDGEIAVYRDNPILAYYHSTCGGHTIDNNYVWKGSGIPYLKGVRCDYCTASPHFSWEEHLSLYDLRNYLGKKYTGVGAITGVRFQRNRGRVVQVVITHKNGIIRLTGNEFRLLLPEKKIRSMCFTAAKTRDGLIVNGNGWGHGVGLCQWGANGMAARGLTYREILAHYYSGVRIVAMGNRALRHVNEKSIAARK